MLCDCGGKSRDVVPREREAGGASSVEGGAAGEAPCSDCSGGGGDGGDPAGGAPGAGNVGAAGDVSRGGAAGETRSEAASGGESGDIGERGGAAGRETGDAGAAGDGASGEGPTPLAPVSLTSVRAYQAVEVVLAEGDAAVATRNAPLIAGRAVMLRGFVTAPPEMREIVGRLSLVNQGSATLLESRVTVSGASEPSKLDSTFVFRIGAEHVTTALEWSLALEEADGDVIARFPAQGTTALGATDASGALELTMVPMVANGFTPDLSPAALERYLTYARAAFPVPDVIATVREAVTLDFPVQSDGTGLTQALDRLYELREADAPADNVYYYGVLTPSATFEEYCELGCTVGLASIANPNNVYYRGGIGTGYFVHAADTTSQETLVHELGHAMGRGHSPCGTDDSGFFPYVGGSIGVWGYDGTALRNPSRFSDVMGYCLPVWVSDYTYAGLFDRIAHVNATASARRLGDGEKRRYRRLIVDHDGALRWGSESETAPPDTTTSVELTLSSSASPEPELVRVAYAPFDHLPGGFALVPAELLVPGVRVAFGNAAVDAP
jgi:hypothetical protein